MLSSDPKHFGQSNTLSIEGVRGGGGGGFRVQWTDQLVGPETLEGPRGVRFAKD